MAPINDNDVKLMLAIIGSAEGIKTDNEKLANIIGGTTANAIRQRVAKIKNQAKAVLDGKGPEMAFGGSAKGKSTPGKAAAAAASADDDDGNDMATPTATPKKRVRTKNVKKAKNEVKEKGPEAESDDESPTKRVKKDETVVDEDGV